MGDGESYAGGIEADGALVVERHLSANQGELELSVEGRATGKVAGPTEVQFVVAADVEVTSPAGESTNCQMRYPVELKPASTE